jgi:hypothetical protein
MAEQFARDAVTAAERGDLAVADGYDLAESDRAVPAVAATAYCSPS